MRLFTWYYSKPMYIFAFGEGAMFKTPTGVERQQFWQIYYHPTRGWSKYHGRSLSDVDEPFEGKVKFLFPNGEREDPIARHLLMKQLFKWEWTEYRKHHK